MKTMKLITVAALAFAAIGFASTSASAQTVTAGSSDLVLGFEINDATGTGATTNLEIDLGAGSNFTTTYANTFATVLGADLSSTYGANWASRTDLVWGVGGVLGSTVSSGIDLTSTVALKTATAANLATLNSAVGSLAGGLQGQTALTSPAAADVSNSNANSWTGARTQAGSVTTDDFGAPGASAGGLSETSSPDASIDLYQFVPNTNSRSEPPATLLGTFTLSGSGSSATFVYNGVNAAAIPEPSAYALGICAVILFVVLRRRSSIA